MFIPHITNIIWGLLFDTSLPGSLCETPLFMVLSGFHGSKRSITPKKGVKKVLT